jgi:hypothetical protein
MKFNHLQLVELFHHRQQVRNTYVAIASKRDETGGHPDLIAAAHALYSALLSLDRLIDEDTLNAVESEEINDAFAKTREAIGVITGRPEGMA